MFFFSSCYISTPTEFVFDVPELMDKDIEEVRKKLGKPEVEDILASNNNFTEEGYDYYTKKNYQLLIRYDSKTRFVEKFIIVLVKGDGFNSYSDMLKIGNLDSCTVNYTTEFDRKWSFLNEYRNVTIHPITPTIIFDIPQLIDKNIEEIKLLMGEDLVITKEETIDDKSLIQITASIKREGYTFFITFNPKNHKVNLLQIVADKGGFKNAKDMLTIANLDSTSKSYSCVLGLTSNPSNKFNAVTIYPNK